MKFIITIDTEADNQWDHGRDLSVQNIKFVPRFQELCSKYCIKPTYLVTSEICRDHYSREVFGEYSRRQEAEIGAHLHSWTTPPFMDEDGFRENDPEHAFATELPSDLLNEKILNLTRQIEDSFGKRPTSFRSGRYGLNDDVARSLSENGYLVDSSVTPFVSWVAQKGLHNGRGGPDFIGSPPYPFEYKFQGGSITEIPITTIPTKFPLNRNRGIADFYFRNVNNYLLLRVLRKLFYSSQPEWLRPTPEADISLFGELINEAHRIKLPFITMMFHSSELMPGCSKYRPDKESVEVLYILLEDLFNLLKVKNMGSVTLTEAAKVLSYENLLLGENCRCPER